MARKPTYEELEQRVKDLEKETLERRQAKEELKRERNIFFKGPVVIFRWAATENWPAEYVSPNVTQFGYQADDFLSGKIHYIDIIYPEDVERIVSEVRDYSESGVAFYEQEYRIIQADGEVRWVYDFTIIHRNDQNEITHYDGYILDTTRRKQAEEALQESEEKYRGLFESSKDGIVLTDLEGKIIDCNQSYLDMIGYTKEEAGELSYQQITPEKWHEMEAEIVKNQFIKRGYSDEFEKEYIKKDGTVVPVSLKGWLVKDEQGQPIGMWGFVRDVSQRKRAEESLRVKDNAIASSINGIALADLEGNLTYANPSFLKLWGYEDKKDILGKPAIEFWQLEDNALEVMEALRDKGGWNGEQVAKRKDGSVFNIQLSASMVTDEVGKPICMMSSFIDITERKHAEEEKEKLQAQLQRSQKMEAIGILAGGVAHDLNNILAGLVSYPELLLLEIPKDSPLRDPILTMQKSGQKAATIVEDLLTLARRGVAVTEVVNLNDIISEYLKIPEHERLISFHANVHVRTNLEADLLNILGSPAHLSKTVMNLVSNAAEAMSEGGTISISTENRYIDRPIRGYDSIEEGDYVILTVSDTGVGILPTDMERIFEPFYTKKVMGRSGTGLGMTVVWGTVKDYKGYIDVQSTEGKGTTFTLYFPVTRKEVDKDKALVSIDDYMGKGESILVVDDVEEQREIASKILKKLDYSVTTVSSGEEAVDYLKDNSVDLLILDMIMDPGIDGLETYKRIIEFHPNQKAIIVSGFSETERVREAQRLGAGAYVKKPFLLEKIGLAVKTELDKK